MTHIKQQKNHLCFGLLTCLQTLSADCIVCSVLMSAPYWTFGIRNDIRPWMTLKGSFQGHECEITGSVFTVAPG